MASRLQTARYEQFLRRLLRIVDGDILPVLQGDISPVLSLEDPLDPALLFWRGHNLAMAQGTQAGAAGVFSRFDFHNPANSTRIMVFDHVMVISTNGAFGIMSTGPTAGTAITTKAFIDTRNATSVPLMDIQRQTGVSLGEGQYRFQNGTNNTVVRLPIVLAPNGTFIVQSLVANETLVVNAVWTERSAESPEINVS